MYKNKIVKNLKNVSFDVISFRNKLKLRIQKLKFVS